MAWGEKETGEVHIKTRNRARGGAFSKGPVRPSSTREKVKNAFQKITHAKRAPKAKGKKKEA